MHNLAGIETEIGDRDRAIALMERAIALRPSEHAWLRELATLQGRARRLEEARATLVRAAALQPNDAAIPALRAEVCRKLRRNEELDEAVQAALAIDPDQGTARVIRARERLRAGELEGAEADVRAVVAGGGASSSDLAAAHHLWGDILERRGRYDAAFEAHAAGNAARAGHPSVRALLDDPFPRRLGLYVRHDRARELYARWGECRFEDGLPAPIILAGFPRSGTTMGEHVLAAHPGVTSTEEEEHTRPVIERMVSMFAGMAPGLHHLERLDALADEQVLELRALYRASVQRATPEGERGLVIVDKHPFRLNDLGLMNRIFPETRAIVMVRDPRDVCVSALFQNFELNPGLVRFLWPETTARWYAALMGFWLELRGMLSIEWMEMRYEDLIGDFEPNARRMLAFAGVGWHEEVARFHERARERVVTSASYNAVTQGLHARSIGRWKHYEKHLGPIIETTAPLVEAFGYARD